MNKLTEWQLVAAKHIQRVNNNGMGAIMPYYELIVAANQLTDLGLAEDRGGTDRRWLTPAGRAALTSNQESNDEA